MTIDVRSCLLVFAAFMIHFICDGLGFSLGVMYPHVQSELGAGKGSSALVASLVFAIPSLATPIASAIIRIKGYRTCGILGGCLSSSGVLLSAWASNIWTLCITMGVIGGMGLCLSFAAAICSITEHFDKRRALATGIAVSGTGIGTFVLAPVVEWLIRYYGWSGSLIVLGAFMLNIVVFAFLLNPVPSNTNVIEIPITTKEIEAQYSLAASVEIVPGAIKTKTMLVRDPRLVSPQHAALLVSVIGVVNIPAMLMFGAAADLPHVNKGVLYGICCSICGMCVWCMLYVKTYSLLVLCCAMFGICISANYTLSSVLAKHYAINGNFLHAYGAISFAEGIAMLIGPVLAGYLHDHTGSYYSTFAVGGVGMGLSGVAVLLAEVYTIYLL